VHCIALFAHVQSVYSELLAKQKARKLEQRKLMKVLKQKKKQQQQQQQQETNSRNFNNINSSGENDDDDDDVEDDNNDDYSNNVDGRFTSGNKNRKSLDVEFSSSSSSASSSSSSSSSSVFIPPYDPPRLVQRAAKLRICVSTVDANSSAHGFDDNGTPINNNNNNNSHNDNNYGNSSKDRNKIMDADETEQKLRPLQSVLFHRLAKLKLVSQIWKLDNEKGELSIVYFVAVLIIAVIVIVVCH
jgi:hypothetical protein